MILFWSLLLVAICLTAITLQKTYKHLPVSELKKRSRKGDEVATALHKAAAYGLSLDLLLWLIVGASAAGFMLVLSKSFPSWLGFLAAVSLLWVGFGWLPKAKPGSVSLLIARWSAPAIAWVLAKLYPLLGRASEFIHRHRPVTVHTGLYDKDDLLELIESQKVQPGNRIDATELDIAAHALKFGDRIIRDIMTPKRMVKFVKQDADIGPLLLDELHKSGFSRFPVTGENTDEIVGTLYMHDLVDKKVSGTAKGLMSKRVFYVQEEQNLWHALNGFLKTKHHLFMVVNNFEEIVGVISIEDVLEQIIGKEIMDEFDHYEDLRAVATYKAEKDQKSRGTEHPTD